MVDHNTLRQQQADHSTVASARAALNLAIEQVNATVLGKRHEIGLAFVCLLAEGHLLIEDLPGLGKPTLARAMAASRLEERRVGAESGSTCRSRWSPYHSKNHKLEKFSVKKNM